MTGFLDDARQKVSEAANTALEAGKVAAGILTLGAASLGAQAAATLNLDAVREGISTGLGDKKIESSELTALKPKALHSAAIRLAESELTPEQRTQLEKEREHYSRRPSPYAATIWMPQKGELMKQVEKRAEEITADARREAEKQVDPKKLAEERSTWKLKMGTQLSLVGPNHPRPRPGPTMMEVERRTGEILEERASKIE